MKARVEGIIITARVGRRFMKGKESSTVRIAVPQLSWFSMRNVRQGDPIPAFPCEGKGVGLPLLLGEGRGEVRDIQIQKTLNTSCDFLIAQTAYESTE
jgi:hypothetical protein